MRKPHFRIPHILGDRLPAECLKRQRPNKLRSRFGHHDLNIGAGFHEQTEKFTGFVCGDTACDA